MLLCEHRSNDFLLREPSSLRPPNSYGTCLLHISADRTYSLLLDRYLDCDLMTRQIQGTGTVRSTYVALTIESSIKDTLISVPWRYFVPPTPSQARSGHPYGTP